MGALDDIYKEGGVIQKVYQSATLGASSTLIHDSPFRGFELHNPHSSKVLSYSLDNSVWFKVFQLGTKERRIDGDTIYLKGSAANSEYQLEVAQIDRSVN